MAEECIYHIVSGQKYIHVLPQPQLTVKRVALFYLVGLYDLWGGVQTLLVSSVGAYAIAALVEGPFMPWIAFVFLMGHMSINHIRRQRINDPDEIDISGKLHS